MPIYLHVAFLSRLLLLTGKFLYIVWCSAYSIFNEDFRELPGTLNADRLDRDIRAGQFWPLRYPATRKSRVCLYMRRTYISVVCSNCMVFLNDLTQRQNFSNQRQSSIELQVVWSKMGTVNGSSAELDCLTNSWKFPPWKFVWPIDPSETYIDLTVGTDFKDCVYPVRLFIEWSVEFLHIAFT